MVWDVSRIPYSLAYMHWVDGGGAYTPWLNSFTYAIEKYRPQSKGFDATGVQKGLDELYFEQKGYVVERVNIQGQKWMMLNALKLFMQEKAIEIPFIRGLSLQLKRYHIPDEKLAQDLVMAMSMAAQTMRRYLPMRSTEEEEVEQDLSRRQTRMHRSSKRVVRPTSKYQKTRYREDAA